MTCKVCKKQYAGKTVDRFRLRWNDYKESDRKFLIGEEIKQKSLHEHFLSDSHQSFKEDVSICLIHKTDPSDPHKREYYWIRTLSTLWTQHQRNILSSTYHYVFSWVLPVYIIA